MSMLLTIAAGSGPAWIRISVLLGAIFAVARLRRRQRWRYLATPPALEPSGLGVHVLSLGTTCWTARLLGDVGARVLAAPLDWISSSRVMDSAMLHATAGGKVDHHRCLDNTPCLQARARHDDCGTARPQRRALGTECSRRSADTRMDAVADGGEPMHVPCLLPPRRSRFRAAPWLVSMRLLLILACLGAVDGWSVRRLFRGPRGAPAPKAPAVPADALIFAGAPATPDEVDAVAKVERAIGPACASSGWLETLTRVDTLRYVRAVASGGAVNAPEVQAEVVRRLLATQEWHETAQVEAIATDEDYSLERFFSRLKPGRADAQEAQWLEGTDGKGRAVAIFFAGRHLPGEIASDEWRKLVIHNGELAVRDKGVAAGPGGQLTLVIDRTASRLRNQDPRLALTLLPELMEHCVCSHGLAGMAARAFEIVPAGLAATSGHPPQLATRRL